jgi:N-methylhydantoinase A/oxoprolinase/acetone carboxylase beta subunit
MRYAGQGYEIAVPCPAAPLEAADLQQLRAAFDRQHKAMFGHMAPDEPVEIVSYRVRGTGVVPPVALPRCERAGTTLADARRELRRVRFGRALGIRSKPAPAPRVSSRSTYRALLARRLRHERQGQVATADRVFVRS